MAQSVAHLIGSEEVTGSIPVSSFRKGILLCGDPLFFMRRARPSPLKEMFWTLTNGPACYKMDRVRRGAAQVMEVSE